MIRVVLVLLALVLPGVAMATPDEWALEGWRTDFSKRAVDLGDILSGGPPRDGIPPIDDPQFKPASEIIDIADTEPVIRLVVDGVARAYPLRVMTWHEIVNDTIAGRPLAVTYCPLCNAAIVFDRTSDGDVLDFGTTGKLRHSDLVMYDRQTETWWQQFSGQAITGALTGRSLAMVPSRLESFGAFRAEFPQGDVLVPNDPDLRRYGQNPYAFYDSADRPFLYSGSMPDGIEPMARVVVVRDPSGPHIVAMDLVRQAGRLKAGPYLLEWTAGQNSALDTAAIAKGRDVGSVRVTRDGVDAVHDITFAFVAHVFHPEADIRMK